MNTKPKLTPRNGRKPETLVERGFTICVCVLIFAGLAAAWSDYGHAREPDLRPPSVTVNVRDLNLHQAAGVAEMCTRIKRAAGRVCRGDLQNYRTYLGAHTRACIEETIQDTVSALPAPLAFSCGVEAPALADSQ